VIGTSLPHKVQRSPNINERRGKGPMSMLVLHYTGMSDAKRACDWLCNEESEVSCHYLVDEQGNIIQMVDEKMRAWHAGVSIWQDEEDINSRSIGIEIQNPGHTLGYPDFPVKQMERLAELCSDIIVRHAIKPRYVLAHSDIAPGRKIDPGEKFDWRLLHHKGVGHYVPPEPISGGTFLQMGDQGDPVTALQGLLKMYGYGIETSGTFDEHTKIVVEAFQRHFRQERVDGVADVSTVATLHKLLRAL
jgi:N-acetylmuramoyl-L-alanine amidase